MGNIEPSKIMYWKDGKWKTARRVFTTEEEVEEWYMRNRWRVDGLSVVVPIKDLKNQSLF